ncbi:NAD(P)H-dependent flavin oxidoreductase [Stutzerimonas nosocomialis]|uniref:NAD(P)H-dependent flavin oxidoreductase n=1 Tax=Stutzerimonas nosocomialis TaxID=1056496 RepID=UPI0024944A3B|nr:nitronate monooxygenase [Stutzerimonas nosocomialis]
MDTLVDLLGIDTPIVQAPMVGVSTPRLAAAVSEAGGLGSIGAGACTVEQARVMIRETRALTDKPFNVNFFCHRPARAEPDREAAWLAHLKPRFAEFGALPPAGLREIYRSFVEDEAMLAMLLEERPAVVSFHFGLPPAAFIESLKAAGIRLLACATTLAEAERIEAAGVDAIVAQGIEAGGHRGVFDDSSRDDAIGTLALVRLLATRTRLPILAAGGIMDGQGIKAARALGAAGVQLGTAFILCPESAANAAYREALKGERAAHTQVTSNISGRPARGLPNRMYQEIGGPGAPALPDYPIAYDAAKALHAAASAAGSDDFAAQWAGQGAPLAREMPAGDLLRLLREEMA